MRLPFMLGGAEPATVGSRGAAYPVLNLDLVVALAGSGRGSVGIGDEAGLAVPDHITPNG